MSNTIKRAVTLPHQRSIDEKINMMYGGHSPIKAQVLTEQQDKAKKKSQHKESDLQSQVCKWLRLQYPDVYFISDFAAGLHLSPFMANLRASQAPKMKVLDLAILEPRKSFSGLIIELKTEEGTPWLKDGKTLKKSEHLEGQKSSIDLLKSKGYAACFAVGLDQALHFIKSYLSLPKE